MALEREIHEIIQGPLRRIRSEAGGAHQPPQGMDEFYIEKMRRV